MASTEVFVQSTDRELVIFHERIQAEGFLQVSQRGENFPAQGMEALRGDGNT
jgi:hypothetical protein